MKRKTTAIVVCLTSVLTVFTLAPSNVSAVTEDEIEQSIIDGITWLISQQNGATGAWENPLNVDDAAYTGFVLIKLQDRAYELGYDSPFDPAYPYSSNVLAGWQYLLTAGPNVGLYAQKQAIGVQAYGDPDSNGNGYGIYFEGGNRDVYYTGICLMTIASTGTPNRPNDGGLDYDLDSDADTYGEIAQEVVDWLAWAQEENGVHAGGWRYHGNYGSSDNSVAGYALLGLAAAEGFGYPTQQWVKDVHSTWIDYIQNDPGAGDDGPCELDPDGGSGYSDPGTWVNMLKTGNLIFEMTFVGDDISTPRFQDALNYIERHWHDANYQPGWGYTHPAPAHYQAMYCLMKGLEYSGIDLIDLDNDNIPEHDWYQEFATVIVNNQQMGGYWKSSPAYVWYCPPYNWGTMSGTILSTVWNLLNLEKITPPPPVINVYVDIKPGSCPNPINLKSKGVLPVAICGTEDFDVTTIDPESILLTREGYEDVGVSPIRWTYEDVATPYTGEEECGCHDLDGDGYLDLSLKFKNKEVVETLDLEDVAGEVIPLIITGNLKEEEGGTPIKGQDCFWVLEHQEVTEDRSFINTKPIYQLVETFLQRFPLLRLLLSYLIF